MHLQALTPLVTRWWARWSNADSPIKLQPVGGPEASDCVVTCLLVHVVDRQRRTAPPANPLGELFRLLYAASAVDADTLRVVLDGPAHCEARASVCRLCDDGPRQVELQLALDISVSAELLHTALFTWTEDAASSEFQALAEALAARSRPTPERVAPATGTVVAALDPLKIVLSCRKFRNFNPDAESAEQCQAIVDVLEKILRDHTPYAGPFRVERVNQLEQAHHLPLVRRLACQALVPVALTIPPRWKAPGHAPLAASWPATYESSQCVWKWLLGLDPLAPEEDIRRHAIVPKITGARIHGMESMDPPTFARVLSVISLSPWLKTLELTADVTRDARNAFTLGRALFSPASSLRLERLRLTLNETSNDAIASFIAGAGAMSDASMPTDQDPWVHEVIELGDVSNVPDTVFAGFVGIIGRRTRELLVKSLTCRQLQLLLTISCSTITRLDVAILRMRSRHDAELVSVLENPNVKTLKLEHLNVQVFSSRDDATEDRRLLLAVLHALGPSLKTLRWTSSSGDAKLGAEVAASLVAHCTALHSVELSNTDGSFLAELADAYVRRACRIARLRLDSAQPAHWTLPPELLPVLEDSSQPIESFEWRRPQPIPSTLEQVHSRVSSPARHESTARQDCVQDRIGFRSGGTNLAS